MTRPKHINTGHCLKCWELMERYPNFHEGLWKWFVVLQKAHPDAHISCAGRGRIDQERSYRSGYSRAHFGQSAHNYNAAIDLFRLTLAGLAYDVAWFRHTIADAVEAHNISPDRTFTINWYGSPGSRFFELPHLEVASWGALGLVPVEK